VLRANRREKYMVVQPNPANGHAIHQPIIVARELEKVYDTVSAWVHAHRGVYLEIKRGDMVAIMGPSRCGNTTLLNVL